MPALQILKIKILILKCNIYKNRYMWNPFCPACQAYWHLLSYIYSQRPDWRPSHRRLTLVWSRRRHVFPILPAGRSNYGWIDTAPGLLITTLLYCRLLFKCKCRLHLNNNLWQHANSRTNCRQTQNKHSDPITGIF